MTAELDPLEQQWPGIKPAQAFVLPSYQWMIARLEAADSRIQTLLTFVATATFAIPTVGHAVQPATSFSSPWFVAAMCSGLIIAIIGITARSWGAVMLLDIAKLWDDNWLKLSEWEFQKDVLYFAGRHFGANRRLVARKAHAVTAMTALFALELALLLIWAARP
jgi:hypothetical protein